ncbi:hypothetical protein K439DRAFT_1613150 [Ramaria rubella]|nr:hypothetical protein K439DRAFT_1613150 [Ramaria rubella]
MLELSRGDDIESIAYVLFDIQLQELPWYNKYITKNSVQSPDDILPLKLDFHKEFAYVLLEPTLMAMLHYARALEFDQAPDYDLLTSSKWATACAWQGHTDLQYRRGLGSNHKVPMISMATLSTMHALVVQEDKTVAVHDVPVPKLSENKVLIKTDWKHAWFLKYISLVHVKAAPGIIIGCGLSGIVVKLGGLGAPTINLKPGDHATGFVQGSQHHLD